MDLLKENFTEIYFDNYTTYNTTITSIIAKTDVPEINHVNPKDQDLSYLFVPFSSLIIIAFLTIAVSGKQFYFIIFCLLAQIFVIILELQLTSFH